MHCVWARQLAIVANTSEGKMTQPCIHGICCFYHVCSVESCMQAGLTCTVRLEMSQALLGKRSDQYLHFTVDCQSNDGQDCVQIKTTKNRTKAQLKPECSETESGLILMYVM